LLLSDAKPNGDLAQRIAAQHLALHAARAEEVRKASGTLWCSSACVCPNRD